MNNNSLILKQDNSGLSLVELIVAISIGVIVSGSIAALITFSIRTYRNESVNTSLQYELQSNINMMMDEIMGASVFAVKQNSGVDKEKQDSGKPYTDYALFGRYYTPSGGTEKYIKGVIFVSETMDSPGKFKVYMNRIDEEYTDSDINSFANAKKSAIRDDKYLLGENLTQFAIVPNETNNFIDTPDPSAPDDDTKTKHEFSNPINFDVSLTFERNGWGSKIIKKHVDDVTYLRNKVTDTVYIDGTPYELKKKDE